MSELQLKKKDITGFIFINLTRLLFLFLLAVLALVLAKIIIEGIGIISPEFIFSSPKNNMTEGGIFPAIFGTVAVTFIMILLSLPLGVSSAIYLNEYAKDTFFTRIIRTAVNNLAGVPSIVFGLFGLGFFILFLGRKMDEVLQTGLLFGQPAIIWASATLAVLVLPQARPGILTGTILAISRGAGETAPVLFLGAAFFLPNLPVVDLCIGNYCIPMINPGEQFMYLAYHIFILATQSSNPTKTLPIQYGSTLVLITLTFLLNITAIIFRYRFRKILGRL